MKTSEMRYNSEFQKSYEIRVDLNKVLEMC